MNNKIVVFQKSFHHTENFYYYMFITIKTKLNAKFYKSWFPLLLQKSDMKSKKLKLVVNIIT